MSYDIDIIDPITYEVLETDSPHFIRGGTYCIDGSCKLSLNITYNYAPFFQQAFNDPNGLKILHNKLLVKCFFEKLYLHLSLFLFTV